VNVKKITPEDLVVTDPPERSNSRQTFRYLPGLFTLPATYRSETLPHDRQNYPDDHIGWEAA